VNEEIAKFRKKSLRFWWKRHQGMWIFYIGMVDWEKV